MKRESPDATLSLRAFPRSVFEGSDEACQAALREIKRRLTVQQRFVVVALLVLSCALNEWLVRCAMSNGGLCAFLWGWFSGVGSVCVCVLCVMSVEIFLNRSLVDAVVLEQRARAASCNY